MVSITVGKVVDNFIALVVVVKEPGYLMIRSEIAIVVDVVLQVTEEINDPMEGAVFVVN